MADKVRQVNHLISIGYLGIKRCYLNVSMEEAKRRYFEAENEIGLDTKIEQRLISEFDFDDEFSAYDVYEKN